MDLDNAIKTSLPGGVALDLYESLEATQTDESIIPQDPKIAFTRLAGGPKHVFSGIARFWVR